MPEIINDKTYLKVTEILAPFSGMDKVPKEILEAAADRGTRTHGEINSILSGMGSWDMSEDIQGYLKSFNEFAPKIESVIFQEKRFRCDELGITGQVDLLAHINHGSHSSMCLVDWKTSSKESPTWSLQGAAYAYLVMKDNYCIDEVCFVKLQKDGSEAKVFIYDYESHFSTFMKCYELYKIFFKYNKSELFE